MRHFHWQAMDWFRMGGEHLSELARQGYSLSTDNANLQSHSKTRQPRSILLACEHVDAVLPAMPCTRARLSMGSLNVFMTACRHSPVLQNKRPSASTACSSLL